MSKKLSLLVLSLIVIGGIVWFWQNQTAPIVVDQKVEPEILTTPVSNFKQYEGNTLSAQFPKDFPNPALEGEVVANSSMVLNQSGLPVNQSTYKFTTKTSAGDILKLYKDYLTKKGWTVTVTVSNNSQNLTAKKESSTNIGVIIAPDPNDFSQSLVTLSISSFEGDIKPQ